MPRPQHVRFARLWTEPGLGGDGRHPEWDRLFLQLGLHQEYTFKNQSGQSQLWGFSERECTVRGLGLGSHPHSPVQRTPRACTRPRLAEQSTDVEKTHRLLHLFHEAAVFDRGGPKKQKCPVGMGCMWQHQEAYQLGPVPLPSDHTGSCLWPSAGAVRPPPRNLLQ